jgi:hypothetical protein
MPPVDAGGRAAASARDLTEGVADLSSRLRESMFTVDNIDFNTPLLDPAEKYHDLLWPTHTRWELTSSLAHQNLGAYIMGYPKGSTTRVTKNALFLNCCYAASVEWKFKKLATNRDFFWLFVQKLQQFENDMSENEM